MKKTYFIVLGIVIVLLIGLNIFLLVNHNDCSCSSEKKVHSGKDVNCNCFVTETLSLDKEQAAKYAEIKKRHQTIALRAIDSLHVNQEKLMDYLASSENNPQIIEDFQNRITSFQKELLNQHIEQYLDLKAILKPSQIEPMNKLFKGLFVCKPSCNHSHKGCVSKQE
jgi:hypothetical protein